MVDEGRRGVRPWVVGIAVCGLLLCGVVALPGVPVRASGPVVTTCSDAVSHSGTSLRDAISAANSGDTITFTPGLNCTSAGAGPVTLTQGTLTIARNLTIDGTGATIAVDGGNAVGVFLVNANVTATLNNLTIQHGNNLGGFGGGGIASNGTLTVTNSTLTGNSARSETEGGGGGISNGGTLTVTNSTFSGNSSFGSGGGIGSLGGTVTVTNSTFSGNSTSGDSGGGIGSTGGTVTVTNSTFSGNSALGGGGAILSESSVVTVTNSTLSGNSASGGGGIYTLNSGTATLTNTLLAANTTYFSGANCLNDGDTITDGGHNLEFNPINTCGFSAGNHDLFTDPLLAPLANYGGPTQTFALLPGSPAIDAGTSGGNVPTTDERGKARVNAPDIGAFESGGFTLTPVAGSTPQSAAPGTAFTNPLAVTVAPVSAGEPVDGGVLTFMAPASGPSASLSAGTATIASGQASVTATANSTAGGPYSVTASASGVTTPATFTLTNHATDTTPPTTTATLGGTQGTNGWYTSAVTVTLSATDNPGGSGVASTTYTLDGGTAQPYTAPFPVFGDGTHTLTFSSTDKASNAEAVNTLTIKIDVTAPTGVTGAPDRAPDSNGWYNKPVKVTFTGQDATSGIASCTSTTYSGPDSATASVSGTCTDQAGNTSGSASFAFKYDSTPPVTTATPSTPPNGKGWNNKPVTVTFSAVDNLSTVAKTEYQLDGGAWTPYTAPVAITTEGTHTLAYRSTDGAGNVETAKSLTVRLDTTAPEASFQFDPTTKQLLLSAKDSGSGVPSGPIAPSKVTPATWGNGDDDKDDPDSHTDRDGTAEVRTYMVTDNAGNTLVVVAKVLTAKNGIMARIVSLQYNGGATQNAPLNLMHVHWAVDASGKITALTQWFAVGPLASLQMDDARYEAAKNQTTIIVVAQGHTKTETKAGMDLLTMATAKGGLAITD